MRMRSSALRLNAKTANATWGDLSATSLRGLKELTQRYAFSVAAGDLLLLEGRWYVTHAGLLRLANRRGCFGIRTIVQDDLSSPASGRWVFKAIVYRSSRSRGFVGYVDADPSNVSPLVRGAELRVAETRAVNRALRKAYGIGLCSVEELGSFAPAADSRGEDLFLSCPPTRKGSANGQPRLRDRLCQLIRQYQLDPGQVKRYATEFCATENLRNATREQVESFITHLAEWAARDRDGLLAHLNLFTPQEVPS